MHYGPDYSWMMEHIKIRHSLFVSATYLLPYWPRISCKHCSICCCWSAFSFVSM